MQKDWFTYNRLPDTILGNPTLGIPAGDKGDQILLEGEQLYLPDQRTLRVATVGSGQPGGIDEEQFDQVIATFRL